MTSSDDKTAAPPFLELRDVHTYFPIEEGVIFRRHVGNVQAVDGVSLELRQGEILGLVGESGCGKSTLARTIMKLVPATSGQIFLDGRELTALPPDELRPARIDFQMVFQDPYASLNPRMTVFSTLAEAVTTRQPLKGDALKQEVHRLMEMVGLGPWAARKYPHEFSGGQRQRIAVARALAPQPKLLIADEPVSALDVSIQSQIINLILGLSRELNLTMLFISHDLSVVKYLADRIAVMYLGQIVELGPSEIVMSDPRHPYTKALVSAIPVPDPAWEAERERMVLQGDPPSPVAPPSGCRFHPRCPYAEPECSETVPSLDELAPRHSAACIRSGQIDWNSPPPASE